MKLALFMTLGGSLRLWQETGILDRELALYAEHARAGWRTTIVSYGDGSDFEIAKRFPFIDVLVNSSGLHPRLYNLFLPLLHRSVLSEVNLIKTNQLYGAHIAYRCARLLKKPLVARQGYGHYDNRAAESGSGSRETRQAFLYERKCLSRAGAAVFTTAELAERTKKRQNLPREKVFVIPNYIVPDVWSPPYVASQGGGMLDVVFFGRLSEEKNLGSLIEATHGLPVRLKLIGAGPLQAELQTLADKLGASCVFLGRLSQELIKNEMRGCDVFAIPSHYEGHPKSLLEAMAFGIPVLAADSPGVREQIEHGNNGILVPSTPEGLRHGLESFLSFPVERRQALGASARKWALRHFSVKTVAQQERDLFDVMLTGRARMV